MKVLKQFLVYILVAFALIVGAVLLHPTAAVSAPGRDGLLSL